MLTWTRYGLHWREATDGRRRWTIELINGRYHARMLDAHALYRGATATAVVRRAALAVAWCENKAREGARQDAWRRRVADQIPAIPPAHEVASCPAHT